MVRLYELLRDKEDRTEIEDGIFYETKRFLRFHIDNIMDPEASVFSFNLPYMKALGAVNTVIDSNGELIQ